jgi:hypothetical protein
MFTVEQYLEMARECLLEAEHTPDPGRRNALIEDARLCVNAAYSLQATIDTAGKMTAKP